MSYFLSTTNHGSISLGDNWTKEFPTTDPGSPTEISSPVAGPGGTKENDYAVTTAAVGESDWDGNFSGYIDMQTTDDKVDGRVGLCAYTSGGSLVDGPHWSDEGLMEPIVDSSLTWTSVTWTGVTTSHYLAMQIEWTNGNHAETTVGVNSSNTYVTAPWEGPPTAVLAMNSYRQRRAD